ncbi:transposase [Microvirga sp. Mcv34]|uniref:transposase n=1 Tax=Microvirga sp. Mcv34 TaxID=2926016 RepID=UPI0021C7CB42|nr:transposase [Microvirga sp. Mcv34]
MTDISVVDLARAPDQQQIIIRQYGLLSPVDWDIDCDEELNRMTKLWNELVDIEATNQEKYKLIIADAPNLKEIKSRISILSDAHQACLAEKKFFRAKGGSKVATPQFDQKIRQLYSELMTAKQSAAIAAKAFREEVRDKLRELEEERRSNVKQARQASGLWWGNYNAVIKSFERGRTAALRAGGQMKLKPYDGSGRFTNQIQGGMSVCDLFAGSHSQVSVAPLPPDAWFSQARGNRRRHQRTFLRVTIFTRGTERRTVTWPMIMHREIPADCRIKEVVVTRRKLATKWRWQVVFTCTRPASQIETPKSGHCVAVNLGWRRVADGIKVATILRSDSDTLGTVIIPSDIAAGFAHADELRSRREKLRHNALKRLNTIDWSKAPAILKADVEAIQALPRVSSGKLAVLWKIWLEQRSWNAGEFEALQQWRSEDKKLLLWEANLRDKLVRRRDDLYRKAARMVVHSVDSVILNDFDIADASRVIKPSGKGNPLPMAARRYRMIAAPSRLRTWIKNQAAKSCVAIVSVAEATTWVCSGCGATNEPIQPTALEFRCLKCGVVLDQDTNACRNMLKKASKAI